MSLQRSSRFPRSEAKRVRQRAATLLETKDDLDQWYFGATVLETAVREGLLDLVEHLIEKGAQVNQPHHTKQGGLLSMVRDLPMARLLLHAGADVNETHAIHGRTPLMAAVLQNQPALVDALIVVGAHRHATDNKGQSLLHVAVNTSAQMVQTVLDLGVPTFVMNNARQTPLHLAVAQTPSSHEPLDMERCQAVLDVLLAAGADVHARGPNWSTPLQVAVGHLRYHGWDLIERLIDHGANLDEPLRDGTLPMRILTEQGASVEALHMLRGRFERHLLHRSLVKPFLAPDGKTSVNVDLAPPVRRARL